jgi:CubicO group peptidase (beta-lactamase class C family)
MRPVTVRQLMNHSSGLPDILLTPELLPLARDWVSKSQVIGMQANTPARSTPGEKFEYCNFNYILLAALIEHVTDTRYSEFMDAAVFESLGMTRSHYDARRSIFRERAQGYEKDRFNRLLHSENIDMSHASAAGALLSSANDLGKWSHLLMSGKLLKPKTLEQAWSPQVMLNSEPSTYGLGFNVGEEKGRRVIWHSGLASGFQAAFSMYPDHGLAVIVLSNGFHLPNTTRAMDQVADIVLTAK